MNQLHSLVLFLGYTLSLQAGTLISIETDTKTTIDNDNITTNTMEAGSLSVYLDADIIDIEAQSDIRIYDYKTWKIYTSPGNGFQQNSLYTDIGFRSAEFQNRLKLGDMLAAAGIQDNPMDTVLMEHLFSMRSPNPASLTRKENKAEIQYQHNGKPLFIYSTKGTPAQSELMDPFIVFLRTKYGIHPDIIDELAKLDYLPERMVVHLYNTGKEEITSLKLKTISTDAQRPKRDIQNIKMPNPAPIFGLVHKTMEMDQNEYTAACESLHTRAPKLAEEGNLLDAACLFVSVGLATGVQDMPPTFFDWKDKIVADPDVMAMFSALSLQSKEDAEKAVETLTSLTEKASDGKFTLLIFKANTLESLNKPNEAADCFIKALKQEPAIVGAWKDLGDIYYNMFKPQEAWACWDAARALNPEHPFLEDIQALEKSLVEENPGLFLAKP